MLRTLEASATILRPNPCQSGPTDIRMNTGLGRLSKCKGKARRDEAEKQRLHLGRDALSAGNLVALWKNRCRCRRKHEELFRYCLLAIFLIWNSFRRWSCKSRRDGMGFLCNGVTLAMTIWHNQGNPAGSYYNQISQRRLRKEFTMGNAGILETVVDWVHQPLLDCIT